MLSVVSLETTDDAPQFSPNSPVSAFCYHPVVVGADISINPSFLAADTKKINCAQ